MSNRINTNREVLALDRGSARSYDVDNRLHVSVTNLSKSNVCEYLGREIPSYEEHGWKANERYKLWRHPEELRKAAKTFNNLPLLSRHVPVSADEHHPNLTVGSTGTDAVFEEPYLKNSLVIWAADSISDVEQGIKKELSCGYRYTLDPTSGVTPSGEEYHGVMRSIIGNHVSLVPEGRAGPDVVVADSIDELHWQRLADALFPARHAEDLLWSRVGQALEHFGL